MNKRKLYFILQTGGWLVYVMIAGVLDVLSGNKLGYDTVIQLASAFLIGFTVTHFYRYMILQLGWVKLKIVPLIPRVLTASIILGAVFELMYFGVTSITLPDISYTSVQSISRVLNRTILVILWSVIYFAYHFFEQYRSEEIKNLKWQAEKTEIELNKLKSQLNPHFIFNSLNTIRALINEDPKTAKKSVTSLSVLLRKTLEMGSEKAVPLREEIEVVNSYLALESARFEERLQPHIHFTAECYDYLIPGLLLQTLVENAVKHGIAKFPQGGKITVNGKVTENGLMIEVENPGHVSGSDREDKTKGFGLKNSKERLRLLYLREDLLTIENENKATVKTRILIPEKTPRL